jgi:GNAT superfamily N-acetyltransferase
MNNVIVREAKAADLPDYVDICMEIWGGKDSQKISKHFEKSFSIFNPGYSIAFIDKEIIGTGEGLPLKEKLSITEMNRVEEAIDLYDSKGKYFYIHGIEVLPKYRNLGIGRALLEYNLNLAKRLNCKQICGIGIDENIDFWIKQGFETEGTWQQYKSVGRCIWIYRPL